MSAKVISAEGATHVAVGVGLAIEGADDRVEGVAQIIGLPAGELAFGDGDYLGHVGFAFFPISRCSI